MIIDFHTHIFPDKLAESAIQTLAERVNTPPYTNGSVQSLSSSMQEGGITYSVVQNIATNPKQTHNVNSFAIELTKQTNMIPFGSIHPDYPEWKEELNRLAEHGIKGIKFHPDYQDFYVDEERVYPIYDYAASLGLILFFHAGVDMGLACDTHCTPENAANMLRSFPGAKIVMAHMGGYKMWLGVQKYLCGKDIYLDSSFGPSHYGMEAAKQLMYEHGTSKILFATDSPWEDQKACVEEIKQMGFAPEIEQDIFYQNAADLLNL